MSNDTSKVSNFCWNQTIFFILSKLWKMNSLQQKSMGMFELYISLITRSKIKTKFWKPQSLANFSYYDKNLFASTVDLCRVKQSSQKEYDRYIHRQSKVMVSVNQFLISDFTVTGHEDSLVKVHHIFADLYMLS